MNTSYEAYYLQQASQQGGGAVFVGPMIQRGYGLGGIFRHLFSFIRPVLKPAARFLGKTLLKSGSQVVSDVAGGATLKDAFRERFAQASNHIAETAGQKIADLQLGSGHHHLSALESISKSIKRKRKAISSQSKHQRRTKRKSDVFDGSDDERTRFVRSPCY